MVGVARRIGIVVFVLTLALAGTAFADDLGSLLPLEIRVQDAWAPDYPSRSYLDELVPAPRIQDRRRFKLRYDRPVQVGQTKMLLRLRASPKPRKLVRFEVRF